MAKYTVEINRFDGGLNTKVTPTAGDPDQSPDLQNVDFDDLGAVKTRNGYGLFTSASVTSNPIDGMYSYVKNDGTSYLVANCGGTVWRMSGNTGVTIPSAQDTFTTGDFMQYMTYQNQLWLSNGTENPRKWNGTEFTRWGVSAPSAATAAVNSAGTQTGFYRYVILGVNSNSVQGDYGSATTEVSLTSERAYITSMPIFPVSAGVNNKAICRNTAGASGVYYVVTTVANAINVYEDNNDDSALLTLAPTDNGLPQNFTTMTEHLGYVLGANSGGTNPSYLYYSNINEPEIFTSTDFIRIGEGDGYVIQSIVEFAGSLLIGKNDRHGGGSLYLLYTPDATPANWSLTRLDTDYGSEATNVFTKFRNQLMYLNRNGIFDLSEAAVGDIKSDALSFDIEDEIFTVAKGFINKAVAITWKNKVWVSIPYGAAQSTNNRVLQYDFVKGRGGTGRQYGAWSRFTGMAFNDFAIHDDTLYGGSAAESGMIYELDTGTNDASSAIDSSYKTMAIKGLPEHEIYTKVWRHLYLLVDASGDWFMELTYINDFAEEGGTAYQVNLDPGDTSLWGTFKWNEDPWGAGTERKTVKIDFLNSVSKAIQLKFSTNTADEYFKIHNAKLVYSLRGRR